VRERISTLQRRARLERLLAGAVSNEKSKNWPEALAEYEEALPLAEGARRRSVQDGIARVKESVLIEKAVATAQREADAGRWRQAWELVLKAREAGVTDARLDGISRRAILELAPQKMLAGLLGTEFVLVEGGTFAMGSDSGAEDERPMHDVALSSFYMSRYEVTKALFETYRRGMRDVPGMGAEGREPVVDVTWQQAVDFCKYLTSIDPAGATCRLPTEAEWEFAARGPEGWPYPWGNERLASQHANVRGASDAFAKLAPVGSFPKGATPSGICDLVGNVAEWCADWAGAYSAGRQRRPIGPVSGTLRVVRGGSYAQDAAAASATARACRRPDRPAYLIGFRVVRDLTEDEREFEGKVR
jgi:formylglycine-generating enzyme required for sulfatase activity